MLRFCLAYLFSSQLLLVFALNAHAENPIVQAPLQDEAWQTLEKAAHAARELSYKGVFTHQSAGNMRSVEITHMNAGQGEYSRVVMLDGSPLEVLRQGQEIVIFNPQGEEVVIEKRRGQTLFPALLPSNMDLIKTLYDAKVLGQERVGGRNGKVINLEPKDQFRYTYRFWADMEYGLLLKVVTINKANQAIEQIAFNQLNLLATQKLDWFQPKIDQKKPYVMEELAQAKPNLQSENDWTVTHIPLGYRQVDNIKRQVQSKTESHKQVIVNQLIFSDGMSSVSLFIESLAKGARPKTGHTSVGPTNFYANVADGHQIIVVGEVPEATVAQFANAVSFKK